MKNYCKINKLKYLLFIILIGEFFLFKVNVFSQDFMQKALEEKSKGNLQNALEILNKEEITADIQTKKNIYLEKVDIYLSLKDYWNIAEIYLQLAKIETQKNIIFNYYTQAGNYYELSKDFNKAAYTYLLIFNLFKDDFPTRDLLLRAGSLFASQNNLTQAEKIFLTYLQSAKNETEINNANNILIDFFIKNKLYNKALILVNKLLVTNPQSFDYRKALAAIYLQTNKEDLAIKIYEDFLEEYPQDENLINNLFNLWKKNNLLETKIKELENKFLQNKNNNYAYILAKIFTFADNKNLVIYWYNEVLKSYPNDIFALYSLANFYKKIKDFDNAKNLLIKLNNLAPWYFNFLTLTGDVYLELGEKERAVSYYKSAFDFQPLQQNTAIQLVEYLINKQLYAEAVNIYLECRKKLNNENIFALELSNLYLITKKDKESLNEYLKYLTTSNNYNPQIEEEIIKNIVVDENSLNYFFNLIGNILAKSNFTNPTNLYFLQQFIFSVFSRISFYNKEKYFPLLKNYFDNEMLLQKAENYFKSEQYKECILVLPETNNLNLPAKEKTLLVSSKCYYGLNKIKKTLEALNQLNTIGTKNISILWEANQILINLLLSNGEVNKAIQTINFILSENSFSAYWNTAKIYLVKAYLLKPNYKMALTTIEQLPANIPLTETNFTEMQILYLRAETYLKNNKFKKALNLYEQLIEINPSDFLANDALEKVYLIKNVQDKKLLKNYLRINDYFIQKKYNQALKFAEKINVSDKIIYPASLIIKSKIYKELNLFSKCEENLQTVYKNYKESFYAPYSLYLLVKLYTDKKNYNAKIAFSYLQELKKLYPDSLFVKEVFLLEEELRKELLKTES